MAESKTKEEASGDETPKERIVTYDFKHPARVSKDQMRTLENLHSNLARMMSSSFSTFHRSMVDVDIKFVDQTTYAEFIMWLSNPSCSYTFVLEPLGGPAIIDIPMGMVSAFIDRQFGGTDDPPPMPRVVTTIERIIMAQVIRRMMADLEATWEPLIKTQVSNAELETNPEFMQVAAPGDTVVLIAFEVNFAEVDAADRKPGTHRISRGNRQLWPKDDERQRVISLCYPYFTLEPIMNYLNVQTWAGRAGGRRGREETRQKRLEQLRGIQTEIRVDWGLGEASPKEVADLRVGDTIVLDTRTDDPGVVYVGGQPIFLARPGLSARNHYAVELLRSLSQEEVRDHV